MALAGNETVFQGIPASPGIAIGVALVMGGGMENVYLDNRDLPPEEVPGEIARFEAALELTRGQLKALQKKVLDHLDASEARIFDSHLLIVDDKALLDEVRQEIGKQLKPAEFVFNRIINRYVAAISSLPDHYIRERRRTSGMSPGGCWPTSPATPAGSCSTSCPASGW